MFAWNFLYSSLCPLPLPVTGKGLVPLSLLPPIRFYTYRWDILAPSLLHTKHSVSSYVRHSYPLIIFVTLCWTHSSMTMSLLYWGAQNSTQHRCGAPRKREGSPPSTTRQRSAYCSPEVCRHSLLPGCLMAQCSFGVHRDPRTFFCQAGCPSACLPSDEHHEAPVHPFLQPAVVAQPSATSTTRPFSCCLQNSLLTGWLLGQSL